MTGKMPDRAFHRQLADAIRAKVETLGKLEQERVLRGPLIIIFCVAAGQAAAEAPFVPPGTSPPDYELTTTVAKSIPYYPKESDQIVMHHDHWTRVTRSKASPSGAYYANDGVAITFNARGTFVRRGRLRWNDIDYEAHNTGEQQTHLGESCTVWEILRSRPDYGRLKLSESSCVTDDGIELWHRAMYGSDVHESVEATKIERRSVSDNEVNPPRSLLALDSPEQDAPERSTKPDYEVVMELSVGADRPTPVIRTVRQSGLWRFTEEIDGPRRNIAITYDSGTRLSYESDSAGVPNRLSIWPLKSTLPVSTSAALPDPRYAPKDLGRSDTILGETCRWYHMNPGWTHGFTLACKTEDGIVLKEESHSRMDDRTWTAVRLTRRPISIDEIKPPAELLEPRTWGLE
ncbi:hypothetical protein [Bradyrhizobium acaciae]|uniref:hypothetical protein n=1 Tax=Bradyrhizobium acaciae TaxID=2683706 RepID=UPI001E5C1D44|nr:hypothetical protein [Bradyrhizobium acaciae]MCC8983211.1 hypothetical protein [Bradyrhizobium acaciae]